MVNTYSDTKSNRELLINIIGDSYVEYLLVFKFVFQNV